MKDINKTLTGIICYAIVGKNWSEISGHTPEYMVGHTQGLPLHPYSQLQQDRHAAEAAPTAHGNTEFDPEDQTAETAGEKDFIDNLSTKYSIPPPLNPSVAAFQRYSRCVGFRGVDSTMQLP